MMDDLPRFEARITGCRAEGRMVEGAAKTGVIHNRQPHISVEG